MQTMKCSEFYLNTFNSHINFCMMFKTINYQNFPTFSHGKSAS